MKLPLLNYNFENFEPAIARLGLALVVDLVLILFVRCLPLLMYADCAYGIIYAELNQRDISKPWSLRQSVIYHKYRTLTGCSTWVIIAPSETTEISLDRYVRSSAKLNTLNPFEIHVLVLNSAMENWRQYIVDLTERVSQQVRISLWNPSWLG